MDINCPDCKKDRLAAMVQGREIVELRCENCGWTMTKEQVAKMNSIEAKNQEEFYWAVEQIIGNK